MNILNKVWNRFLRLDNAVSRYSVKLKRDYRLRSFRERAEKVVEICGGRSPFDQANLNVDILDHPAVDVIADLNQPLPFRDKEVDKIISIATLEHFGPVEVRRVLGEFFRILKDGGILEVGVPSLEKIFRYYQKNGCDDFSIRFLHGAQKDQYDIHLYVVDFKRFKADLEGIGFKEVMEADYDYPFHSAEMMMKITAKK